MLQKTMFINIYQSNWKYIKKLLLVLSNLKQLENVVHSFKLTHVVYCLCYYFWFSQSKLRPYTEFRQFTGCLKTKSSTEDGVTEVGSIEKVPDHNARTVCPPNTRATNKCMFAESNQIEILSTNFRRLKRKVQMTWKMRR